MQVSGFGLIEAVRHVRAEEVTHRQTVLYRISHPAASPDPLLRVKVFGIENLKL